MNKETIDFLIKLEKEYGILSCDRIDQEKLFKMQDEITQEMMRAGNKNKEVAKLLLSKLSYIFKE